jgi:hypothetical protein
VSKSAADEFASVAGRLWIPPGVVAWQAVTNGVRAEWDVEGTAPDVTCRLIVAVPRQPWPAGSFSLIWRSERLRGFDLSGSRHKDPRTGRSILPPHCQWFDDLGQERVDSVDLLREGISTLQHALRWFLAWSGVEFQFVWHDPPIQPALPNRRRGQRRP